MKPLRARVARSHGVSRLVGIFLLTSFTKNILTKEFTHLLQILRAGDLTSVEKLAQQAAGLLRDTLRAAAKDASLELTEEDLSIIIAEWADDVKRRSLEPPYDVRPEDHAVHITGQLTNYVDKQVRKRRAQVFRDTVRAANALKGTVMGTEKTTDLGDPDSSA